MQGEILKRARLEAGLSQAQIGALIWPNIRKNPAQCRISRLEKMGSVVDRTIIRKYAAALGLSENELIQPDVKTSAKSIGGLDIKISRELLDLIPSMPDWIRALNALAIASPNDKTMLFRVLYAWIVDFKTKLNIDLDLPDLPAI